MTLVAVAPKPITNTVALVANVVVHAERNATCLLCRLVHFLAVRMQVALGRLLIGVTQKFLDLFDDPFFAPPALQQTGRARVPQVMEARAHGDARVGLGFFPYGVAKQMQRLTVASTATGEHEPLVRPAAFALPPTFRVALPAAQTFNRHRQQRNGPRLAALGGRPLRKPSRRGSWRAAVAHGNVRSVAMHVHVAPMQRDKLAGAETLARCESDHPPFGAGDRAHEGAQLRRAKRVAAFFNFRCFGLVVALKILERRLSVEFVLGFGVPENHAQHREDIVARLGRQRPLRLHVFVDPLSVDFFSNGARRKLRFEVVAEPSDVTGQNVVHILVRNGMRINVQIIDASDAILAVAPLVFCDEHLRDISHGATLRGFGAALRADVVAGLGGVGLRLGPRVKCRKTGRRAFYKAPAFVACQHAHPDFSRRKFVTVRVFFHFPHAVTSVLPSTLSAASKSDAQALVEPAARLFLFRLWRFASPLGPQCRSRAVRWARPSPRRCRWPHPAVREADNANPSWQHQSLDRAPGTRERCRFLNLNDAEARRIDFTQSKHIGLSKFVPQAHSGHAMAAAVKRGQPNRRHLTGVAVMPLRRPLSNRVHTLIVQHHDLPRRALAPDKSARNPRNFGTIMSRDDLLTGKAPKIHKSSAKFQHPCALFAIVRARHQPRIIARRAVDQKSRKKAHLDMYETTHHLDGLHRDASRGISCVHMGASS